MLSDFSDQTEGWYVRQKKDREWKHTTNYDFMRFCKWKGWQIKTAAEYERSHLPFPLRENSVNVPDLIL